MVTINQPPDPSAGLNLSVENLTFIRLLQNLGITSKIGTFLGLKFGTLIVN